MYEVILFDQEDTEHVVREVGDDVLSALKEAMKQVLDVETIEATQTDNDWTDLIDDLYGICSPDCVRLRKSEPVLGTVDGLKLLVGDNRSYYVAGIINKLE